MSKSDLTIAVEDLAEGDEFHSEAGFHYTVLAVTPNGPNAVMAHVRFADGGDGYRDWDTGTQITIKRG